MNNPFQLLQAIKNPQQLINKFMNNEQVMSNPMIRNAVDMAQKGDSKGIEQLVRNIAQSKGMNADELFNQVKSQIKF